MRGVAPGVGVLAVVFVLALAVAGCSVRGEPVGVEDASSSVVATLPGTSTVGIRQTDDLGRRLPFTTVFPNRWSGNNDGTSYEPCTAASPAILGEANLDPQTVRDAAVADHQTARGCRWNFVGERLASLGQYLGNLAGSDARDLAQYKASKRVAHWYPDLVIDGRTVASNSLGPDSCTTFVQSGQAVVATSVSLGRNSIDVSENCRRAFVFTRATISQMPR
ncbi:DUF3558 family protein [Gordonia bronchialis]|uniref:DUF3558 family protein n=1 Tax=Gordonia bronchialis TaxID=2054 RepID=UPI0039845632